MPKKKPNPRPRAEGMRTPRRAQTPLRICPPQAAVKAFLVSLGVGAGGAHRLQWRSPSSREPTPWGATGLPCCMH